MQTFMKLLDDRIEYKMIGHYQHYQDNGHEKNLQNYAVVIQMEWTVGWRRDWLTIVAASFTDCDIYVFHTGRIGINMVLNDL